VRECVNGRVGESVCEQVRERERERECVCVCKRESENGKGRRGRVGMEVEKK
jgi:predicted dinucleotide-utilizing enzyme